MLTKIRKTFLQLVRLGIGNIDTPDAITIAQLTDNEWHTVEKLANAQGLLAVALDGLDYLTQRGLMVEMPAMQKKIWIGQVLQNYEHRHEMYRKTISELAGFYNARGFKMMVLKGYACSLDWPKSEHRPSGDIDIWLFGQQKAADTYLSRERGMLIDYSHHHHTVFVWRGFIVENHYDFINVHARKSNRKLEAIFKELGADDSHFIEEYAERVYLPSANLHALFLIRHMVAHFSAAEITLRQVLDWAFFVQKHGREVDWPWLLRVLEEFGQKQFFDIVNGICVENLGFSESMFPYIQFLPSIKDRVLADILQPEFDDEQPFSLVPRVWFRYRRWQANAWKQRLCYKESRWSAFWRGIWNHLLKPRSI